MEDSRSSEGLNLTKLKQSASLFKNNSARKPPSALLMEIIEEMGEELDKNDAAISELKALIIKKDALIAEKDALIDRKDAVIAQKETLIAQKEARIAEKDAHIARKDALIAQKDAHLAEKDTLIAAKDALILKKEAQIAEKDALIAEKDELIVECKDEISDGEKEIEKLRKDGQDLLKLMKDLTKANSSNRKFFQESQDLAPDSMTKYRPTISPPLQPTIDPMMKFRSTSFTPLIGIIDPLINYKPTTFHPLEPLDMMKGQTGASMDELVRRFTSSGRDMEKIGAKMDDNSAENAAKSITEADEKLNSEKMKAVADEGETSEAVKDMNMKKDALIGRMIETCAKNNEIIREKEALINTLLAEKSRMILEKKG